MCAADAPLPPPILRPTAAQLATPAFITIPIALTTLGAITKTHIYEQHLQETPQKTSVSTGSLHLSQHCS